MIATCGHVFCESCEEAVRDGCKVTKKCKRLGKQTVLLSKESLDMLVRKEVPKQALGNRSDGTASSPKFDRVLQILAEKVPSEKKGGKMVREKTLIFSQWTGALDLLSKHLVSKGYTFQRIDGTMSVNDREKSLEKFKRHDEVGDPIIRK